MKILGIETSCDETGAAVYDPSVGMLSNIIFSQTELHKQYGGVIPELASRSQLEKITPIVEHALVQAYTSLEEIECIAVTNNPGLPGSLLIGVCFAKALAWSTDKKLIGINHLEGHIFSGCIENNIPFPHLCLTASGGHTALYLVHDFGVFELLGQTLDDAAGEAFDKVAKMLGLPYPGGPVIEKMAQVVEFQDFCNYPRGNQQSLDFSFSGLKTAVLYDLVKKGAYDLMTKQLTEAITSDIKHWVASSLLVCIADIFEQKISLALKQRSEVKAITFVGGVACNKYIKKRLNNLAQKHELSFFTPSPLYCTDNAGMIAFVGNYKAERGEFSDLNLDILK
jgi:N6-L-threonylcarbamoyladenine synthase